MIEYVTGDATEPGGRGCRVIAHIVNDAGKWGAGFTGALDHKWPEARDAYLDWAKTGLAPGKVLLQSFTDLYPGTGLHIAHLCAQHGTRNRNNPVPVRLDWLSLCLANVRQWAQAQPGVCTVHMPRIGTGLGGGRWEQIEPLIENELTDFDIPVTVYDLPVKTRPGRLPWP